MRLAWCRPRATRVSDRLDDTAALIAELGSDHEITCFDRASMHELVRLDFRQPFGLHVFELGDTDDYAFLWPYVLHYPGIVRLRSASLHHSRAASLARQRRSADRRAELSFGGGDLTVAPLLASRMVVVDDDYLAEALRREYPHATVRVVPNGVGSHFLKEQQQKTTPDPVRVGVLAHPLRRSITNAVDRARDAGARIELVPDTAPDRVLDLADVVLFMPWPPSDDLTAAIAAMSSARPLVIVETGASAGWPTVDPQTWQPRGLDVHEAPIAISIDPRDEEHSLVLALRRLAVDAELRNQLGAAAHMWWERHATVARASATWRTLLHEAASLPLPARPPGWPSHLTADGTERARAILGEFAVAVDFLS